MRTSRKTSDENLESSDADQLKGPGGDQTSRVVYIIPKETLNVCNNPLVSKKKRYRRGLLGKTKPR